MRHFYLDNIRTDVLLFGHESSQRRSYAIRWVPHYVTYPEYERDRPMNSPTYLFYFEINPGKLLFSLEVGFSLLEEGLGPLGGVFSLEDV